MGTLSEEEVSPLKDDDGFDGGVKLPQLVHSQSSPSFYPGSASDENMLIAKLQDELSSERLAREHMSQRVKSLEDELEQKIQRSASQPLAKGRFGISRSNPYRVAPFPPPPSSPKQRGVHLPALRTLPQAPSPQRFKDEQSALEAAEASMEKSRNKEISRAERSKARVEAIKRLESQGMVTWKERKAEKVAKLNDLTIFRESMWGSFFNWHEEYNMTE